MRQKMENNICLACLATNKKLKNSYCSKCIKELFDGTIPNPLNFNKVEFTKKRAELSPRMSISGVQDKISLRPGLHRTRYPVQREMRYCYWNEDIC